ncbi:MAG: 3'-5' exonuclease [Candidatus Paceibacterota bacterium]|jgi:DNA polymerase III epsilon subunit family exonuclease
MKKHNLAFVDIEMTGLNMIKNEIIEIGCVITTPRLKVIEKFELKIKPEHIENADITALKINHYSETSWESAFSLKEAMKIFLGKVKDCIMIGQNVSFDSEFLEYAFIKTGLKNSMHYHKLDTISIAWAKLNKKKTITHFSLRELCKYFNVKNKNPHSALSDAYATYELYKKLINL